jgi:myosin-1
MMAKALYDFSGQTSNELSIKAGEMLEIVQKENNGKSHSLKPLDFLWLIVH